MFYERFVFKNKRDAETVLDKMKERAELYVVCLVEDLYNIVSDVKPSYKIHESLDDWHYGWNYHQIVKANIAYLVRSTGFIIDIADPFPVDKSNEEKSEVLEYEFTRNDIKPGYAVKLRNGEVRVAMPVGTLNTLILTKDHSDKWTYLSSWKIDLKFSESAMNYHESASDFDIMEVYSCITGTDNYNRCGDVSTDHRKLLWSRVEAKKMTVAEISKELGYPVEIVEG